ncbi:MAG: hypothetical protein K5682_06175, partial [Lachnospiraceae bacterium]|nr:hypothetical protein [Lachnospiraceae bacterium]
NHAEDSYLQVQVAERILRGKDLTNAEQDFREEILRALERTIVTLGNADWNAACIRACRLWQAGMHKPQDRVEMFLPEQATALGFAEYDLLTVCSKETKAEKVRLGLPGDKSLRNLDDDALAHKEEYVFLTNRLIEIMFGREWIMGREEEAGLRGIPFLLYKNLPDIYSLGIPKADQIDGVSFSSGLYEEKKEEAKLYDYVVYNRYTDSRLFVDYGKADYKDYGRVKDAAGQPASKIMIPRYQRKLLGYLDQPLKMIRAEEFPGLLAQAEEEDAKILEACYERISGETYYSLKEDTDVPAEQAYQILKKLHVYDRAELLKIPKKQKEKRGLFGILRNLLNKGSFFLLDKTIGKAEYLLKCEWTSETDDRNNVARLSSNMMSLIGVAENDKIRIKFGNRVQILRVLKNDDLGDYQIGIPATARKKLGMNSVNDIVVVHRDMVHIFLRHSEEQTIAILGTVLAVFQVTKTIWLGILACLIFIPLIMYFVLNEERVKVK